MRLSPVVQSLTEPLLSPLVSAITGVFGGIYTPQQLFIDGSKGVFYDNNDLSSFYADAATPATVNGIVGIQFDKSQGMALGAELITNGTFPDTTGWTANNSAVVSAVSGRLRVQNNVVDFGQAYASFTAVVGQVYAVTSDLFIGTSTSVRLALGNSAGSANAFGENFGADTTGIVRYVVANATTMFITVQCNTVNDTAYVEADNISVKAISGNHRYQTTTGSKPILRGTPTGANLVTNGDFASDTVWTKGAGWTIGSGVGTKTAGTASGLAQSYAFTVGKVYRCTYTLTVTAGSFQLAFTGGTTTSGALRSASGTYVEYLTAQTGNNAIYLFGTATYAGTIDNVEIVDVSAGSVTAPYGLQYDGVDDFMQTAAINFATATSDGLARRNLLTFPSALDDAAWTKSGLSVTPNNSTAPDGSVTADFVYVSATGTFRETYALASMTSGVTYTQTYYVKAAGLNYCQILFPGAFGGNDIANFDLTDGTVGTVVSVTTGLSAQIQSVGSGWYRISATFAGVATGSYRASFCLIPSKTAVRGESMTADALNGIHVWGAQLEAGSTASAFQDIGTGKMFVCAGVRKLSDAADGTIVELSPGVSAPNNGSFNINAPGSGAVTKVQFATRGTATSVPFTVSTTYNAPFTGVVTGISAIATDTALLRINGTQVDTKATDQGTGNYGNYAIYFGRQGGASIPYNGLDFGMVIVGKTLTATQISQTERFIAQRTGVTL